MDDLRQEADDEESLELEPYEPDEEPEDVEPYEPEDGIDAAVVGRVAAYGVGVGPTLEEIEEGAVEQDAVDDASNDAVVGDVAIEALDVEEKAEVETEAEAVGEGAAAAEAEAEAEAEADVEAEAFVAAAEAVAEAEADAEAVAEGESEPIAEGESEPVAETDAEQSGPDAATIASGPSETERRRRLAFRQRRDDRAETGAEKRSKDKRAKNRSKDVRAKKLVGLKIGASQLAAAQVVNNGAPELVEVFREPLEPGLVVSGEIRDADALGAAIKRFFELHKLPKRNVRLGVANNRIGVRVFDIEGVTDPQQLENAIRFRAEEVLPIPLDQAVLDYVVLEDEVREDDTPVKRILLVVAYREVVDRYLQACHGAGLQVVGIDLEAFALLRSLEAPADRDSSDGALVAVAIGHDRTTIAVSTGRLCEFTRVLDWGGWSLNVAIARELDRAPSEVEAIKRQLSFARDTEIDGLTPEQVRKTRDAVQRALAAFTRELVASLHFYQAQPGALGIGEIVLTGGSAHMNGLTDAVGQLVGVPIRLGDPFKRVKVGPNVAQDAQYGSVAVAIGLGIEE